MFVTLLMSQSWNNVVSIAAKPRATPFPSDRGCGARMHVRMNRENIVTYGGTFPGNVPTVHTEMAEAAEGTLVTRKSQQINNTE